MLGRASLAIMEPSVLISKEMGPTKSYLYAIYMMVSPTFSFMN